MVKNLLVLSLGLTLAWFGGRLPVLDYVNYLVQDRLVRSAAPPAGGGNTVIVGVDDPSLEAFPEPLILWHHYFAGVIDGARIGQARALGMDMIPGVSLNSVDRNLDRALFKALRNASDAGLAVVLGYDSGGDGMAPLTKFQNASSGLAYLNFWPDRDGIVRSYSLAEQGEQNRLTSLAARLVAGASSPPQTQEVIHVDYHRPPPAIISLAEIYRRSQQGDEAWLKENLGDKVLLMGVTTRRLHDHHRAPISAATGGETWIYGVMIHALAVESLLSGEGLRWLSPSLAQLSNLVFGVLAGLLFLRFPPSRAAGLLLLMAAGAAVFVYLAFQRGYLVPAAPLVAAIFLPALVAGLHRYVVEYWQFRKLQRYFKSYVSPGVMNQIIEQGSVALGGGTVTATVMFTDIRNFTSLSERMPPVDVVAGLNRYFEAMTGAVVAAGGYLNRYLGDGILAIFGAPLPLPRNGAVAAVDAAFAMLELLEQLNHTQLFPGVKEIHIGIGIHTGEAIVGNIGCAEKMDYSIIGDTVNLASRIESKTKEFHASILISESTRLLIDDVYAVDFIASVQVKGREQTVNLYRVIGRKQQE